MAHQWRPPCHDADAVGRGLQVDLHVLQRYLAQQSSFSSLQLAADQHIAAPGVPWQALLRQCWAFTTQHKAKSISVCATVAVHTPEPVTGVLIAMRKAPAPA